MEHGVGGARQGGWDTEVWCGRVGMVVQLSGSAGRQATRSNPRRVALSSNQLHGREPPLDSCLCDIHPPVRQVHAGRHVRAAYTALETREDTSVVIHGTHSRMHKKGCRTRTRGTRHGSMPPATLWQDHMARTRVLGPWAHLPLQRERIVHCAECLCGETRNARVQTNVDLSNGTAFVPKAYTHVLWIT